MICCRLMSRLAKDLSLFRSSALNRWLYSFHQYLFGHLQSSNKRSGGKMRCAGTKSLRELNVVLTLVDEAA